MYSIAHRIAFNLRKSLANRGVAGTIMLCVRRPIDYVSRAVAGRARTRVAGEREFDRQYGVETTEGSNLRYVPQIDGPNWAHGNGYQPTPATVFRQIMGSLGIDVTRYAFVDLGSGKGITILLAAELAFRQVMGVEYCANLHATAELNLQRVRERHTLKCPDVALICGDALEVPLPPGPLIVYMYNPFDRALMERLRDVLDLSLRKAPRELVLLYYNPVHGDVFNRSVLKERSTAIPNLRVFAYEVPASALATG